MHGLAQLASYRTATNDNETIGLFVEVIKEGFVGEIGHVFDAFDWWDACATTCGDDKVFGFEVCAIDVYFTR